MLNQEGAIDPSNFEWMRCRSDGGVGKGMLGLTIQCSQCHNHSATRFRRGVLPDVRLQQRSRSASAVYTPDEQMKIAAVRRASPRLNPVQHRRPDWRERMAAREQEVTKEPQPEWQVVQPAPLRREFPALLRTEGSIPSGGGLRPTKMTATFRNTSHFAGITAFRLELLTVRISPFGGPGRSFMRIALTEFNVEVLRPLNRPKVKEMGSRHHRLRPTETGARILSTINPPTRVTGPLARDNDENTAWGIDAGAGRRNTERQAVFDRQARGLSRAASLLFLKQNHGGWNSDDHMTITWGAFGS
jgi:hypothetical protein